MERFMGRLLAWMKIRTRLYHLVMQFILLTFRLEKESDLRKWKR